MLTACPCSAACPAGWSGYGCACGALQVPGAVRLCINMHQQLQSANTGANMVGTICVISPSSLSLYPLASLTGYVHVVHNRLSNTEALVGAGVPLM